MLYKYNDTSKKQEVLSDSLSEVEFLNYRI